MNASAGRGARASVVLGWFSAALVLLATAAPAWLADGVAAVDRAAVPAPTAPAMGAVLASSH